MFLFATPVSRQTRNRKKRNDWREEIRAKALELQTPNESPWPEPVRVRIGYYFHGDSLDIDNILKAILDGLKGVVYTDDNLVADLVASKRSLDEFVRLECVCQIRPGTGNGCRLRSRHRRRRDRKST